MKLVTFSAAGSERLGFVEADQIVDPLATPGDAAPERAVFHDMDTCISSSETGLRLAKEIIAKAPPETGKFCAMPAWKNVRHWNQYSEI